jgi:hypothetical protein
MIDPSFGSSRSAQHHPRSPRTGWIAWSTREAKAVAGTPGIEIPAEIQ